MLFYEYSCKFKWNSENKWRTDIFKFSEIEWFVSRLLIVNTDGSPKIQVQMACDDKRIVESLDASIRYRTQMVLKFNDKVISKPTLIRHSSLDKKWWEIYNHTWTAEEYKELKESAFELKLFLNIFEFTGKQDLRELQNFFCFSSVQNANVQLKLDNGFILYAHKEILFFNSEVIRELFKTKKIPVSHGICTLKLKSFKVVDVLNLLNALYDQMDIRDCHVKSLLQISTKLQIIKVRNDVQNYLLNRAYEDEKERKKYFILSVQYDLRHLMAFLSRKMKIDSVKNLFAHPKIVKLKDRRKLAVFEVLIAALIQ